MLRGDREADMDDRFIAPRSPQQALLVRAAWDRKPADPPAPHRWAAAEAAPLLGTMPITVPAKPEQRARAAPFA